MNALARHRLIAAECIVDVAIGSKRCAFADRDTFLRLRGELAALRQLVELDEEINGADTERPEPVLRRVK